MVCQEDALAAMPEAIWEELKNLRAATLACERRWLGNSIRQYPYICPYPIDPDWENKKSFPNAMVEPVKTLGRKAIDLRIMDDRLFDVMPNFIHYNRFTMKRWMLNNCKDYLLTSIDNKEREIISELKAEIDSLADRYIQDWEKQAEEFEFQGMFISVQVAWRNRTTH
jgi:hypothetical protein